MQIYDCSICGSAEAQEIAYAREYTGGQPIHVCSNCGFVHVKERRSAEEIARAWDDLWGDAYSSSWPGVKARLYYVAEWFHQKFGWQGKSVLDIGAGEGTFLKFLKHRADRVLGLDPSKANCEKMQEAGIDAVYDWIGRAEPFAKFDVVTILWTLENTWDCRQVVRFARDSLRPDGILVIATGSRILVPFKKPLSHYFSTLPADMHAFRFGFADLLGLCASEGLHQILNNDFEDRDEMVVVFVPSEGGSVTPSRSPERANAMHKFFGDWHRLWP